MPFRLSGKLWALALCAGVTLAGLAEAAPSELIHRPAARLERPMAAGLLGVAHAGQRLVAVGDRGAVLLSDDGGASFRQARSVPTRVTLTSVSFADERNGWAVGHWGVILRTTDGGETWSLQRDDTSVDQPLFSVWFSDARNGVAAGLWSLILRTDDGGEHWEVVQPPAPPEGQRRSDRNLFQIFPGASGELWIAAERGGLLYSGDGGAHWSQVETGGKGSLWTGTALTSGTLLVAGLQGKVYRSADHGSSWQVVPVGTASSLTHMVQMPDGGVVAVGVNGAVLESHDDGRSFSITNRADQASMTAVAPGRGARPVLFSAQGVLGRTQQ